MKFILFDYGGVIGDHYQDPAEYLLCSKLGVDRSELRALLSESSEQGELFRENKIKEIDFWKIVFGKAGKNMSEGTDVKLLSNLWAKTYTINEKFIEKIQLLRKYNKVGVLTNIDIARSRYLINTINIMDYIDEYFPSYKYKAIKPKPKIWDSVTSEINKKFKKETDIIYIDDRLKHIEASNSYGWTGIQYKGLEDLLMNLERIGVKIK